MIGLEVNKLNKSFRHQQVLNNISLDFQPNTIYGLLGRNGVGKTTLLNIIANRIYADSGTVTLDGKKVANNDQLLGRIYLMSERNLYRKSQKLQQILNDTQVFYEGLDMDYAQDLAAKFQLNLDKRFGSLSTGYRSIFKLIIALTVNADYILLDEPVLGLDSRHRDLFYQELIATYTDNPRTFVISTHLIGEIAHLIGHAIIMGKGSVLLDEDVKAILAKAHLITGPAAELAVYTQGLNVIGSDKLGRISGDYVFDDLPEDRPVPDQVEIEQMTLEKLFVFLTQKEGAEHVNQTQKN